MLANYPHDRKFLSIEPVMDFDLSVMLAWAGILQPDIVEIGADNYHNHLPEPDGKTIKALIQGIKELCPVVVEKPGLERLYGAGE